MSVRYRGEEFFIEIKDGMKSLDLAQMAITSIKEIGGLSDLVELQVLILSNNKITQIEGLEDLKNLELLYLDENQIEKIEGLDSLNKLKLLDLTGNKIQQITGLIGLLNLVTLRLSFNQITRIQALVSLNLAELDLGNNRILRIEGLDSFEELLTLNLRENKIQKIEGLGRLTELDALDLCGNQINKIEGLGSLENIQELNLGSNNITKLEGLEGLISLQELILTLNNIQEIKGIEQLVNLQELYLGSNEITRIEGLHHLSNLEVLDLSINKISLIEGIESLQGLQSLNLLGNRIKQIEGLKSLQCLQSLNISGNRIKRIEGLESLGNLKELFLWKNQITKIEGLQSLEKLKKLSLWENQITTIEGLQSLGELQELTLTDNQIANIVGFENLGNLKSLDLSLNRINRIQGLQSLGRLETLDLGSNQLRNISGLKRLGSLKIIDISNNQISLIDGLSGLKHLQKLDLRGNPITDAIQVTKLLSLEDLNEIYIDYEKLKNTSELGRKEITQFLTKQYDYLKGKIQQLKKRGDTSPGIFSVLDEIITVADILANLYDDKSWREQYQIQTEIKKFLEEWVNYQKTKSGIDPKVLAFRCVFLASFEETFKDQITLLEEAVSHFNDAGELQCSLVQRIHTCHLRILQARELSDDEGCKQANEELSRLYEQISNVELNPFFREYLDGLNIIQKNLTQVAHEPGGHLQRKIHESNLICKSMLGKVLPVFQFGRPNMYRLFSHIAKDFEAGFQKYSKSSEKTITNRITTFVKDNPNSTQEGHIPLITFVANPDNTPKFKPQQITTPLEILFRQRCKIIEAPKYLDLGDSLRLYSPDIVVFFGHGELEHNTSGTILIHGEKDEAIPISIQHFDDLIQRYSPNTQLVIFFACNSDISLQGYQPKTPYIIGFVGNVYEVDTKEIAMSFFSAIARGSCILSAFRKATSIFSKTPKTELFTNSIRLWTEKGCIDWTLTHAPNKDPRKISFSFLPLFKRQTIIL